MNETEKQKLIRELKDLYKKLKSYKRYLNSQKNLSEAQKQYEERLREELVGKSSVLKETISGFTNKLYFTQFGQAHEIWDEGLNPSGYLPSKLTGLNFCIDATNEAISKLESKTVAALEPEKDTVVLPLKAFIAHEGETKALDKLTDFLIALNIKPIIAEKSPSGGNLVEPHVGSTIHDGDFVIILATKGKAINKKTKKSYMGQNVADELGRAREANMKVILLLETGIDPHTNISGIIWENFKPQSMDKAFTKIVRELMNWGFIMTTGLSHAPN